MCILDQNSIYEFDVWVCLSYKEDDLVIGVGGYGVAREGKIK